MFGSGVLDIGIGLIFVYLMVSLVCTAANEALASLFHWRADTLHDGIRNLLDGPDEHSSEWAKKFYDHPLVRSLYRQDLRPSYIPSRTFALALIDLVLPAAAAEKPTTAQELRNAVAAAPCPDGLKHVLQLLIDEADRSSVAGQTLRLAGVLDLQKLETVFEQLHQHIEIWFNNTMERVSGWYKRRVHAWTIGIAIGLTALLNVDSVLISRHLARDSALRSAIVAQAEEVAKQPPSPDGSAHLQLLQNRIQELKSVGIPLGWPDPDGPPAGVSWFLLKFLGILLTAGAASLGAPFWFDVLNRFMSIRAAGKAPEETPKPPRQIPMPAPPGQPDTSPAAGPQATRPPGS
jgi:hypothetical protein